MIFLANIFDVLEAGVYFLIYADDIILYALGSDPLRALTKLQNCLDRLVQWCAAYYLTLSPDKSVAIDFSRGRNTDSSVYLMGQQLEWQPVVKILGVWFGRSLLFNHHFSYLRAKAFKRMNYIKAVASCSRGVSSVHLLRIIDCLIRSLLEYACPLFIKVCPSSLNSLEVIYNAALRVATGLPKCTPIPLLRREAGASSVSSRLRCLTHRFLIRQLSSPSSPFLSRSSSLVGHLSAGIDELLALYNVDSCNILGFSWPTHDILPRNCDIVDCGLPFQIPSLPSRAVHQAWLAWRGSIPPCTIIASDASKDDIKTAIAVYHDTDKSGFALLVPHVNSVFTAEAFALYMAISSYVSESGHYVIITDSLSVLRALRNVSIRSPKIILKILNLLYNRLTDLPISVTLIWCPGHKGIPPNEMADDFARNGPYRTFPLNWVAPEDLASKIYHDWQTGKSYAWMNSDYFSDFPHLTDSDKFRQWTISRKADVWISRWRTRMWLTNNRLYRMKLTHSPLCHYCCVVDTPDHVLLQCALFSIARTNLFATLGLPPHPSYSEVLLCALRSHKGVSALTQFSSVVAGT